MKYGNEDKTLFGKLLRGDEVSPRPLMESSNGALTLSSDGDIHDADTAESLMLEALYRANFQRVYNYAYYRLLDPALAEDITSTVFVKAVANFEKFDESKASFSTWIIRIAHNTLVDYYRMRKETMPLDNLSMDEPSSVDEYPALDDHAEEVARLLSFISEEDRELIFLKYYEDKRNVEIAQTLDMNPATVATRLRRALMVMRSHVEEVG